MKFKALSLILYTFLVLFSCTEGDILSENQPPEEPTEELPKEEEPVKPKTYPKAVLDISDAASLVGLENVAGGRVASEKSNLFKITDDGKFEMVAFVYPDGSPLDSTVTVNVTPSLTVFQLYHVNPDYLLLTGQFVFPDTLGGSKQTDIILARKSDGAIFGFERGLNLVNQYGVRAFKHDAVGNVYFMTSDNNVAKLSLDNPDQLTRIPYLATGQQAIKFEILPDGTCLYEKGGYPMVFRVRKLNGGIFDFVPPDDQVNAAIWTGSDNQVYCSTYSYERAMIYKVTTNNNDVVIDTVAVTDDHQIVIGITNMHNRHYRIHTDRSTIFVSDQDPDESFEFFEDDKSIRGITLPFVKSGCTIAGASKFNYYITVDDNIYKVDISTHAYTKILSAGEFEIYSMTVNDDDVVQFSGLRFSDGKKILAEIKNGTLNVIEEEMNRTAVILERLY